MAAGFWAALLAEEAAALAACSRVGCVASKAAAAKPTEIDAAGGWLGPHERRGISSEAGCGAMRSGSRRSGRAMWSSAGRNESGIGLLNHPLGLSWRLA